MKLTLAALCLLTLLACQGATSLPQPAAPHAQEDDAIMLTPLQQARADALLELLTSADFGAGASVTISAEGRRLTLFRGERWPGGPPVTAQTRFNLASVSKTLTAAALVQRAHRGELSLEDPLRAHLPGVRLLAPDGREVSGEVSLRQLLQHRAGLPHQPGQQLDPASFGEQWQRTDLLAALTRDWSLRLEATPGQFRYSNMGYALLGAVLEQSQRCEYFSCMNQYLQENGLSQSGFHPQHLGEDVAHGRPFPGDPEASYGPGWYLSGYALPFTGGWASSADLARFGEALGAASQDPGAPLHEMARLGEGYGLGVVHTRAQGLSVLSHDGSGPGFLAQLVVVPERALVLAVVSNGGQEQPAQARRFLEASDALLAALLSRP